MADDKGVDSLARQIKMTGRAYPLFEIAQMILQRPERIAVTFHIRKNPEGQPIQPLFLCALDDSLWLSEDEVVAHVLQKHFGTFYQAERTATEPPKGKYTFVAQCGMSGVTLGPPNYHDYQNQLHKLHAERFSRMPFEAYKSRVRIVRDEEVVKKWVEDQSWKTEYICLNLPEPVRLPNREAVEKHFRETHKENIIRKVDSQTLSGIFQTQPFKISRPNQGAGLLRECFDQLRQFFDHLPLHRHIGPETQPQFGTRGPLQVFQPYSADNCAVDFARMHTTLATFRSAAGETYVYLAGASRPAVDDPTSAPPSVYRLRVVTAPGQPAYLEIDAQENITRLWNPGSPVVTSDGGASPIVWVLDSNQPRSTHLEGPGVAHPILYAFDGVTLTRLWHSSDTALFVGGRYSSPTVAHGTVFVGTDRIQAYGAGPLP